MRSHYSDSELTLYKRIQKHNNICIGCSVWNKLVERYFQHNQKCLHFLVNERYSEESPWHVDLWSRQCKFVWIAHSLSNLPLKKNYSSEKIKWHRVLGDTLFEEGLSFYFQPYRGIKICLITCKFIIVSNETYFS